MIKPEENVSLAEKTAFKIGGRARYFFQAKNSEELEEALVWAKEQAIPCRVFGGGTNLLIGEKVFDGLVIQVLGGETAIVGKEAVAEAGVVLGQLIKKTIEAELGGLEKLAGIPGTTGGAVVGNAGAYGTKIGDRVKAVKIWDEGEEKWLTKKEAQFDYRWSIFKTKPWIILAVKFELEHEDKQKLMNIYEEINQIRRQKWPKAVNAPGCFFKNVPLEKFKIETVAKINPKAVIEGKVAAGYLLDQTGAKKEAVGKAKVADFHADVIYNEGGASFGEVKKLAQKLNGKVKKRFGVELEPEVIFWED